MVIAHTIEEVHTALRQVRIPGRIVGLVPTMGALHDGHRSLLHAARARCDNVVASIFVNPTQFGPNEDFGQYPRTFDADCRMLEQESVDILFAPSPEEMYPAGADATANTVVHVAGINERLDGASRPGHFDGVATVVTKLFNIIQPQLAFFGQKDAAQVAVLRRMVRDLNQPVELVVCRTIREEDGLAMSSRNRYLSTEERHQARVLSRALIAAETLAKNGEGRSAAMIDAMRTIFAAEPNVKIDYLEIVNPDTLLPIADTRTGALIAVAAHVGTTRLIDNLLLLA